MTAEGETPDTGATEEAQSSPACAVDSSVALAAILTDDDKHEAAEQALADSNRTIAHVTAETYSVLTRLPPPHRLDAATAAAMIEARLPSERITLDADVHATAIRRLANAQISGGATYDGLIALTALEHDLELVSADRRATRTYKALGIRFRLIS